MDPRPTSLGEAIRLRRIEIGLTQEELAARVGDGVRQSDISRLEHDRIQLPRASRLRAIASALEMEPGELLIRSGWAGAVPALGSPTGHSITDSHSGDESATAVSARLAEALEHSRQIRGRVAETLKQSNLTADYWLRQFETEKRSI